jgi:hypothetical protein
MLIFGVTIVDGYSNLLLCQDLMPFGSERRYTARTTTTITMPCLQTRIPGPIVPSTPATKSSPPRLRGLPVVFRFHPISLLLVASALGQIQAGF